MTHFSRRRFLQSSALLAGGLALSRTASSTDSPFPAIAPEEARVDAAKLAELTDFIDAEVAAGTIPGAGVVATRSGRKFIEHFTGTYRDAEGGDLPFHPDVANPLFSFSKGITATIAMLLKQEGLLDFDVPVSTYIPEYTGGGKDATTLRHLLTHAAGIPGVSHGSVEAPEAWQAYLDKLCAAQVEWPVGSRTAYHGLSGMFVVGEAIRRVSGGASWESICRARLFDPLGAESMTFAPPRGAGPFAVLPGYFDSIEPGKNGIGGHPAGGGFGTPDDMLRVLHCLQQGGTWGGETLLRPEAQKELLTVQYAREIDEALAAGKDPVHEPWGIGWLVRGTAPKCPGGPWFGFGDGTSPTLFGHAGVDTIYGVADPARELAFVFVMTKKLATAEESTRLRREVSNRLQGALLEA